MFFPRSILAFFVDGRSVLGVSIIGVAALYEVENEWFTLPFSICVFSGTAALFFLVSNRIAFSVYSAWAIMGTITLTCMIKFKERGFGLHAYDFVFVGSDASLYSFLLNNYLHLILPVVALGSLTLFVLASIIREEKTRGVHLAIRLTALAAFGSLLPVTIPATASIDRHEYIVGGHHASAFYVSLLDIPSLFTVSDLEKRLTALPAQSLLANTVTCAPRGTEPDVFMVLSETQTPLANFPQLGLSNSFSDAFRSDDGKVRALGVETFGGGTWISNLSLMTGLSAADFGWQRPYLTTELQGKVEGSFPETLRRCGYRTATIMPMESSFVNEGAFLESIGFETILDASDIGAGHGLLRDMFYYEAAERFIAEHRSTDKRPLFLAVQTMFAHGPYKDRLEPALKVPGEPLNNDPDLNEYLRRVWISRRDFQNFLSRRSFDPTERGTVVLEFGDHQASVTSPFVHEIEGAGAMVDLSSLAYTTHYSTHAFGYRFQTGVPEFARLDVAFLGATFSQLARLPSSPLMSDLIKLRDRCKGLFHSCEDRERVDQHLRARVDSGLLDIMD